MPCARFIDDRGDHVGLELRVRHPDLDEVDVLRLQAANVCAGLVGRRRLEGRRSRVRTADVESLPRRVRARREESARARLPKERYRFGLVVARRPHRRHTPAQLRRPVPLHGIGRLVDVAVHVDEAGQQHAAARVDDRGAGRNPHPRACSRRENPIALRHDD